MPDPRPAFEDWTRANDAGIDIAPPPAELRPWRAGLADIENWQEPPKRVAVGDDALVMACDPEPPEAQGFRRAAERARLAARLFETDRRLEGYGWYDRIERVVNIHTTVTAGGRPAHSTPSPYPSGPGRPRRRCPYGRRPSP